MREALRARVPDRPTVCLAEMGPRLDANPSPRVGSERAGQPRRDSEEAEEAYTAAADRVRAPRLGSLAHSVAALVASVVALEQLGVETEFVVTVITHILAAHFLRRSLPSGDSVEIAGQWGVVERVGALDTLVRGEAASWSIPNGKLIEEIVTR